MVDFGVLNKPNIYQEILVAEKDEEVGGVGEVGSDSSRADVGLGSLV